MFQFNTAPPAKQNRWGVFFRGFMALPQAVFAGGTLYVSIFLTFFAWFYMIFKGRNPYHDFNSKVVRVYVRYWATYSS